MTVVEIAVVSVVEFYPGQRGSGVVGHSKIGGVNSLAVDLIHFLAVVLFLGRVYLLEIVFWWAVVVKAFGLGFLHSFFGRLKTFLQIYW